MYIDNKPISEYWHYTQVWDNYKTNKKQECLHDQCPECHGTGVKKDGTPCIHYISCPCPKCTPKMY